MRTAINMQKPAPSVGERQPIAFGTGKGVCSESVLVATGECEGVSAGRCFEIGVGGLGVCPGRPKVYIELIVALITIQFLTNDVL